MGFVYYDLAFMAVFIVFVIIFLKTRKKNLSRQGILFLYKTQFGVKFIDGFAKKFKGILRPFQYVVIASGVFLTATILWLMWETTRIYLTTQFVNIVRTPPIAPLIPYFPKVFGLESFFPPLYFTYFIIALAIVAIAHEAAHGIYARFYKFKVLSTGFVFLGPILGAFVEPDEKQMAKGGRFKQMVVLGAGTFANVLMAVLFGAILLGFFSLLFFPAGVKYDSYGFSQINVDELEIVENGFAIEGYVQLEAGGKTYFTEEGVLEQAKEMGAGSLLVFDDTGAFRAQLEGAITSIDGVKVKSKEEVREVLQAHSPGDVVKIKTAVLENGRDSDVVEKEFDVVLGEREGLTYLGVADFNREAGMITGLLQNALALVKDPYVFYESKIGVFGWFLYYLLWWIVVINVLVALFNMLPIGFLDGGRFFYLGVWGLTGNEKVGRWAFKAVTWLLLLLFLIIMFRWVVSFF